MNNEILRQLRLEGFDELDGPQIADIYESRQSIVSRQSNVSTARKDQPRVPVRNLKDIEDDNDDRNRDYRRS